MIHFAIEEPKLFQLLFMTENESVRSFGDVFAKLETLSKFPSTSSCGITGYPGKRRSFLFSRFGFIRLGWKRCAL